MNALEADQRRLRQLTPVLLIVALASLVLLVNMPTAHAGSPQIATATVAPQEQVIGTATSYQTFYGTFWQNGTSEYQSAATPFVFPANFTNYSALTYAAFSVGVSIANFLSPMVNVAQGSTLLLNNTGTSTYIVYPPSGSENITTTVPEAFLPGGGIPPVNAYAMDAAGELLIQYQSLYNSQWHLTASALEQETFQITAPTQYWLNSTTVYLPFPLPIQVNYTSAVVLLAGSSYPYTQVTSNGFYLSIPAIGPGVTDTFSATYSPIPTVTGANPIIVIKNYSANTGSGPNYIAYGSWANTAYTLWGGTYIVNFDISYVLDPTSVNITVNNHYVAPNQFIVSGDTITILPSYVITPIGTTAKFVFKFNLPSAPASGTLTTKSGVSLAGYPFTVADLLWLLIIVSFLVLVILWLSPYRVHWRNSPERYSATYGLFVLMIVCGAILYLPVFG